MNESIFIYSPEILLIFTVCVWGGRASLPSFGGSSKRAFLRGR